MGGTYKAIGINLKGSPMGESDRLLTILTREHGLLRAVAPGSRKHDSSLRGRSGLFVVNQLLIAKGRSLDKIIQAETLASYTGLSQDLRKLTAGQYLAELVLFQAFSEQPQDELFTVFQTCLIRLEQLPASLALACLTHATVQLLELAGLAPRLNVCCVTQQPVIPDWTDPDWRIGFSTVAGGTVTLSEVASVQATEVTAKLPPSRPGSELVSPAGTRQTDRPQVSERSSFYKPSRRSFSASDLCVHLNAIEWVLLQQLADPDFIQNDGTLRQPAIPSGYFAPSLQTWLSIERILRHYAQYHFERPIRSAALIDTVFLQSPSSPLPF